LGRGDKGKREGERKKKGKEEGVKGKERGKERKGREGKGGILCSCEFSSGETVVGCQRAVD